MGHTNKKFFSTLDLSERETTLAHVMHKAGVFKSISEARRNGWNKPVCTGIFNVGPKKRRWHVVIVDRKLTDSEKATQTAKVAVKKTSNVKWTRSKDPTIFDISWNLFDCGLCPECGGSKSLFFPNPNRWVVCGECMGTGHPVIFIDLVSIPT